MCGHVENRRADARRSPFGMQLRGEQVVPLAVRDDVQQFAEDQRRGAPDVPALKRDARRLERKVPADDRVRFVVPLVQQVRHGHFQQFCDFPGIRSETPDAAV